MKYESIVKYSSLGFNQEIKDIPQNSLERHHLNQ
jgi:hypothetical protein